MKESVLKPHLPFQSRELKDSELVAEILIDCLEDSDLDTFTDVLKAHLLTNEPKNNL